MNVDPKPTESPDHIEDDLHDPCPPSDYDSYEAQCREELVYGPEAEYIKYEHDIAIAEDQGIAHCERLYALKEQKLHQRK